MQQIKYTGVCVYLICWAHRIIYWCSSDQSHPDPTADLLYLKNAEMQDCWDLFLTDFTWASWQSFNEMICADMSNETYQESSRDKDWKKEGILTEGLIPNHMACWPAFYDLNNIRRYTQIVYKVRARIRGGNKLAILKHRKGGGGVGE